MTPRGFARIFGILAAGLLVLYAITAFLGAIVVGILGHHGAGALAIVSVLALVYAALTLIFTFMASHRSEGALAGGVVLVVLALSEWAIVPTGSDLLGGLALVLTLLAGILFVIDSPEVAGRRAR
ncbi:MAG: hypothetical protein ACRECR_05220 [Thermoplasmata archaeon]